MRRTVFALAAMATIGACATTPTATHVASATPTLDYTQAPTYGAIVLQSGFTPDPMIVNITAGGPANASSIPGCSGYVGAAPDLRVTYSAGSFPLHIAADSSVDTTIVVNAPDGRWYCNDNNGGDRNPHVSFAAPASGQYDIWVGLAGPPRPLAPASLTVSEVAP
ncbi:MAG: hypothetical protein ABL932_06485 [Terricaulis sp.]